MSQMIGCASRGLGTWPDTGPLGTEVWASGAGDGGRTGQGIDEWEEAEANVMGWGGKSHSGLCLQQLWGLTAKDAGTDRTRQLTSWGDASCCSCLSCLSISWTLAEFWI